MKTRNTLIHTLAVAGLALLTATPAFAAKYHYTGNNFDTFRDNPDLEGAYTTNMRVTGWVQFAEPVESGLNGGYIDDLVVDYRFDDGRNTMTPSNADPLQIQLWTDEVGAIYNWTITVADYDAKAPLQPGDVSFVIQSINYGGSNSMDLGNMVPCENDPGSPCSGLAEFGRVISDPGTWVEAPEPSASFLIWLGGIVLASRGGAGRSIRDD